VSRPAALNADVASETPSPRCHNCGAAVATPYCGACGQRFETHLRSLGGFLAEAGAILSAMDL
jgi:hypothetical protein